MESKDLHEKFMRQALKLADKARQLDEVPVGALIVYEGQIIAESTNLKESLKCVSAHAEVLAIREASKVLDRWRLTGCSLYVTLEPCLMCAGAIVASRLDHVIFGTHDPKGGAAGSLYSIFEDQRLNHQPKLTHGVLKEECSEILKLYFKSKRSVTNVDLVF